MLNFIIMISRYLKSKQAHERANMEASIIIVSWNGLELLRRGLPSVVRAVEKSGKDHEIIVVDDGSTDGSADIIAKEFPAVRVIALNKNVGFGAACNKGAEAGTKPIVIMLNNDMIVEEDFIPPLIDIFADERVFAVSCLIKKWDMQTVEIGRTWGFFQFGFLKLKRTSKEQDKVQPALYASGGAVAYRKSYFFELGGFDSMYHPFYWEDTDLSYRALKRGWKVIFQPESIVYHKHQGTIGKAFSKRYVRAINYRNRFLFIWRNISDSKVLIVHFIFLLPYLLITLLLGRFYYIQGFIGALSKLNEVLEKRRIEKKFFVMTDADVIKRVKGG